MNGRRRSKFKGDLPYELIEEILATLVVAEQGNVSPFHEITRAAPQDEDPEQGKLLFSCQPVFSAMPASTTSSIYTVGYLSPELYFLSNSQVAPRSYLAQGVKIISEQERQAEEYSARIYSFEKPFPKEETAFHPDNVDVPRIPKLKDN